MVLLNTTSWEALSLTTTLSERHFYVYFSCLSKSNAQESKKQILVTLEEAHTHTITSTCARSNAYVCVENWKQCTHADALGITQWNSNFQLAPWHNIVVLNASTQNISRNLFRRMQTDQNFNFHDKTNYETISVCICMIFEYLAWIIVFVSVIIGAWLLKGRFYTPIATFSKFKFEVQSIKTAGGIK